MASDDTLMLLKLLNASLSTANQFTQMSKLNNDILVNQEKMNYAQKLKDDETARNLATRNKMSQNAANIKETEKSLDEVLLAYKQNGATNEDIYKKVTSDMPESEYKDLFDEENAAFTRDFRFLKGEANTLTQQFNLDSEQIRKSNLLLKRLNEDLISLEDNEIHMQSVGTKLGAYTTLKDIEDVEYYMKGVKDPDTGLNPFKNPIIETDENGNIVFEEITGPDGQTVMLPKVSKVDGEVQYEEGWSAKGDAMLTEKFKTADKLNRGFLPTYDKGQKTASLKSSAQYLQLNTSIRSLRLNDSKVSRDFKETLNLGKKKVGDRTFYTGLGTFLDPGGDMSKLYNNPEAIAGVKKDVESALINVIEKYWDNEKSSSLVTVDDAGTTVRWYRANPNYKKYKETGDSKYATLFLGDVYQKYMASQQGYVDGVFKEVYANDTMTKRDGTKSTWFRESYDLDMHGGLTLTGTKIGETEEDKYFHDAMLIWKHMHDLDYQGVQHQGLLNWDTAFDGAVQALEDNNQTIEDYNPLEGISLPGQ